MKTKIRLWIPTTMLALSSVFLVTNCTKDDDVTKDATLPVLTTTEVIAVTQTTATSGGEITSDGGATVTERGVCWSTSQSPTIADNKTTDGSGTGSFTSAITELIANTTYYVRAYATNSAGTGYGSVMSFNTSNDATLPVLTTTEVTAISQTTATSGGVITSDGGFTVTERGVCWSTSQSPTIADNKTTDGSGTGSFTSAITELIANTTYYVRAYATNSKGTGYGSVMSFTTPENSGGTIVFNPNITYGSMTDIDGNTYKTVTIGTQTWMAENLRTTKYNDGTAIPLVTDDEEWSALTTGAYCNYNNTSNTDTIDTYGRLYNWYAVNTGKLAPTGWHVPTDAEWTTLITFLGDESDAGGKLKETGTTHWNSSKNTSATNETGFTALPGGYRNFDGTFYYIGYYGRWWSATVYGTYRAWYRDMYYDNSDVRRIYYNTELGFSVRCLRD